MSPGERDRPQFNISILFLLVGLKTKLLFSPSNENFPVVGVVVEDTVSHKAALLKEFPFSPCSPLGPISPCCPLSPFVPTIAKLKIISLSGEVVPNGLGPLSLTKVTLILKEFEVSLGETVLIENIKNLLVSPLLAINTCPLILFSTKDKLFINGVTSLPLSSPLEICNQVILFCVGGFPLTPNPHASPFPNDVKTGVLPFNPLNV